MRTALALALVLLSGAARGAVAQTLRIYHIDVDQASATLFVSPAGHTLLVDSGKNGQGVRILSALQHAGVGRIDFFVDTHYHEDHYGGIDEVVGPPTAVAELVLALARNPRPLLHHPIGKEKVFAYLKRFLPESMWEAQAKKYWKLV